MLTPHEEKFLIYWEKNRERDKKMMRQLFIGLPVGLLLAGGILLSLDLDWYERANMVANAELNPVVLLIAVLGIVVFIAIFYKKYDWEMKEQRYQELIFKKQNKKSHIITDEAAK